MKVKYTGDFPTVQRFFQDEKPVRLNSLGVNGLPSHILCTKAGKVYICIYALEPRPLTFIATQKRKAINIV